MRLFHLSDTHIGSSSHFERQALSSILEQLKESTYDLLVHTGDVTESGKPDQYREGSRVLDSLDLPRVVIPGNHDARSGGLALFEKHIGPRSGVDVQGNALVIHVDSSVADSNNGRVGMVKFKMMRQALNDYGHLPIKIVAIHHHTIPTPRAGRERNILSNAGDLLDLFLRFDVDLVLSGHRHYPNVHRVNNTVFVNAGTASGKKTRYGDVNSYNVIEIKDDSLTVGTRRLNGTRTAKTFPRRRKRLFQDFGPRRKRIVQMSNSYISNSRNFLERHFHSAVDTINRLSPDAVVHCGGIVEEGIAQNYELGRAYMSQIDAPVFYTPAGRDINYLGYHLFPRYFGAMDQCYRDEEICLQGLASSQYDSRVGVIGDTERAELFERMEDAEEPLKGVFLHHNVMPIPHARERGLLEDAGDLLRECVDAKLDLVLTGTSSHPHAVRVGSTVIVNANSLSSVYQRSVYGNSFNVVDIFENAIAVFERNSLWGTQRLLGMWSTEDSGEPPQ